MPWSGGLNLNASWIEHLDEFFEVRSVNVEDECAGGALAPRETNMANYSVRSDSVLGSLLTLGLVLMGAVAGCSAESPPAPEVDETVQDPLLFSGFCGGRSNKQCGGDKVCTGMFARGCPDDGGIGVCLPRPRSCPSRRDPVCGCDGVTYDNMCQAVKAGASALHVGACAVPPDCDVNGAACPGNGECAPDRDRKRQSRWWNPIPKARPGTCECNASENCGPGERFNDSPLVCACEGAPDPCDGVACPRGQECLPNGGAPSCVPDACSGISCGAGRVCVVQPDRTASCMTNTCSGISCGMGQACVVAPDGSPACWPNVCAGVACKNGQSCIVLPDGTAGCR